MSGGGDSGDSFRGGSGGGGGSRGADPCAIVEQTVLSSPVAAVVTALAAGSLLNVVLVSAPKKHLQVRTTAGATAGSITSTSLVELIECIENGKSYVAEVLSATGGRVTVEIRPA